VLGEHFGVTEGPIWIQEGQSGYLLFSDMPANVVYKWTPDGQVSVFLEKSGFTGTDNSNVGGQSTSGRLAVILLGSNGLTLDPQGRLVMATHGDRSVVRLEKDGTRTVLADRYEGKRLNSPNDVVVKSDGAVYVTDAPFGLRGREKSPQMELNFNGLYLVKDGKVQLLDKDPQGGFPNGIAFSPDEKYLYVSRSSVGGKILRYDVQPDDTVTNARVFIDTTSSDGMKVDRKGNIYLTSGGVWVVSPEGKHLGTIHLPKILGVTPTNLTFGDADRQSLYITARTHLFRIRVKIPGTGAGIRP